jgi:hypothetical protein
MRYYANNCDNYHMIFLLNGILSAHNITILRTAYILISSCFSGQTQQSNQAFVGTKRSRVSEQIAEPQYRNVATSKVYHVAQRNFLVQYFQNYSLICFACYFMTEILGFYMSLLIVGSRLEISLC